MFQMPSPATPLFCFATRGCATVGAEPNELRHGELHNVVAVGLIQDEPDDPDALSGDYLVLLRNARLRGHWCITQ